jgi:hypothetical protein
MVEAFDPVRLDDWLRARGASARVRACVARLAAGEDPPSLDSRECELVLDALMVAAIEPVVHSGRVAGLVRVARALGYGEDVVDGFVQQSLRITLRRLEAYATLKLPLGATAEDVKAAHRRLVKVWHPDRQVGADADALADAARRVMALNEARALLNQPYEDVVLDGGDDVVLEGGVVPPPEPTPVPMAPLDPTLPPGLGFIVPPIEAEDAPTELYEELSWSEVEGVQVTD